MRNFILGLLSTALLAAGLLYFLGKLDTSSTQITASQILQSQLKNVSKLVVTEGHFSEIITYTDAKKMYLDMFTAEKKAIVLVNAKATIGYDLSKIKHQIDEPTKTITILELPAPEITIIPEVKYHNLQEDFFNPFTPEDHNQIQQKVSEQLQSKIKSSSLFKNAKNRLLSELHQLYILTNSLGWTLKHNSKTLDTTIAIDSVIP